MSPILRTALCCVVACLLATPVRAGEFTPSQRAEIVQIVRDALKQDPSILRDAVTALQAEDGDRQQASSRAAIAAAGDKLVDAADPTGGNPKGDVTIVEFFDTRCPYCRKLEPAMADLLARDHGVRLVYKDLPILGPASVLGSKALLAANPSPTEAEIRRGISGNLCRCTCYVNIVRAIQYGAATLRGETPVSIRESSTKEMSESHA